MCNHLSPTPTLGNPAHVCILKIRTVLEPRGFFSLFFFLSKIVVPLKITLGVIRLQQYEAAAEKAAH